MAQVRTRLRRPQRRTSILEAGTSVFAAHGYHAASMRDVAEAAEIAKPILYDHFGSKQGLYVAVLESIRDELTSGTEAAMRERAPVDIRVRDAIDGFFRYAESRPAAAKVLFTAPEGELEVVRAWERVQAEATARLVALVAAERGKASDGRDEELRLELWMEFLKKGLHGLAGWWAAHPRVPRRALVNAAMDVAWSGLATRLT